jgi:hypothetical protein
MKHTYYTKPANAKLYYDADSINTPLYVGIA